MKGGEGWKNFTAACVAAAFYASTRKCPNFFSLFLFCQRFLLHLARLCVAFSFCSCLSLSLTLSLRATSEALILFDCSGLCTLCRCEREGVSRVGLRCLCAASADLFNELGFCGVVRKVFCAFCHENEGDTHSLNCPLPSPLPRTSKTLLLCSGAGEMAEERGP